MSTQSQSQSATPGGGDVPVSVVPLLVTGDRLTRDEFERRYEAMPWLKHAELIEGVVYVGSPVGDPHATTHARLTTWLGVYAAHTVRVRASDAGSVRLDEKNEFQPDGALRLVEGGQTNVSPDNFVEGAPELTAEVAYSSASRDMHEKLEVYRRQGVREYIVWRVKEGVIDWFRLHEGQYQPLVADADGITRSVDFPGLWLDTAAMLSGDMAKVLAVLNQGLASPEHAAFAGR